MTPEELQEKYPDLFETWWKQGYEDGKRAQVRAAAACKKEAKKAGCHADEKLCPVAKEWKANHKSVVEQFRLYRGSHLAKPITTPAEEGRKKYYLKEYKARMKIKHNPNKGTQFSKGSCIYCGQNADTIDHLTPKSRGGSDGPSNKLPACRACNLEKGNMTYDEYIIWRTYHKP